MIATLERCFESAVVQQSDIGIIDVTQTLRAIVKGEGRHVMVARLRYSEPTKHSWLAILLGLRDQASPVSRLQRDLTEYRLCDIPSLVPGLAAVISHRGMGLAMDSLFTLDDAPSMLLVFEGSPTATSGSLRSLSTNLWSFLRRWSEWEKVFTAVLVRDPFLRDLPMDVRDFLSGETLHASNSTLSYNDRALMLERLVTAAKALLTSILDQQQMSDPIIANLIRWLVDLQPNDALVAASNKEVADGVF